MVSVLLQADSGFVRERLLQQIFMLKKFEIDLESFFPASPSSIYDAEIFSSACPVAGDQEIDDGGGILPVYSLTEGLSQHDMRKLTKGVVEDFVELMPEPFPASFRARARQ